MAFKTLLLSLTLMGALSAQETSVTTRAKRNLCDDMVDSGKSTDEQISKCIAKLGESEHSKKIKAQREMQKKAEEARSAEAAAKKANIEVKKFTVAEIEESTFGKPIYAIQVDYTNQYKPKTKRITSGDALCKYLGYEKALKTIVSSEIKPLDAHKNGMIIDTNFFGVVSKEPELYEDEKATSIVRKYVEITCAKVKSTEVAGTADELSKVAEDLIVLNEGLNAPVKEDGRKGVNDGSRKPSEANKTPNSFKVPEFMKDEPASDSEGGVTR